MGDKDIIESKRFNTQVTARVVFMFSMLRVNTKKRNTIN